MNRPRLCTFLQIRMVALALALTALGSAAQARNVEFDTACAPKLGYLDQRLYGLANQGADELRRFVWTRRGIYELNVMDTADWVDQFNLARTSCLKQLAQVPEGSRRVQALAPTPPR